MYPENPEGTQVIVGSMNMGYISDTARNRAPNLFRPKREPIPLGHSDELMFILCPVSRTLKENSISLGDAKIKSEENARYFERLVRATSIDTSNFTSNWPMIRLDAHFIDFSRACQLALKVSFLSVI